LNVRTVPQVRRLPNNALEAALEPLDRLHLSDAVRGADASLCPSALGDALTGAGPILISAFSSVVGFVDCHSHAAVEVHAVDADGRVVLDTQIDVFADTEAEVARLGEVALPQLVFLDLEASLENFLGLGTADGDVDGDLFVTTDTECSDGVSGLACSSEQY
jgi:hypothetical protein